MPQKKDNSPAVTTPDQGQEPGSNPPATPDQEPNLGLVGMHYLGGAAVIGIALAVADTEALVGEAIAEQRNQVFLVSKVYPQRAGRRETITACCNGITNVARKVASMDRSDDAEVRVMVSMARRLMDSAAA